MQQANAAIDNLKYQAQECYEVCRSFLYFIINYCWIEDKVESKPIPFDLWPSQRGILKDFLEAYRLIILKARQLGLTWMCAAYSLWLCITKPLQLIIVISAKEDWAIEFLDRVKFILDRLPDWMVPPITKRTGQILEFTHNNNLISQIKSLATTPEGAQSKTPTLMILDETARNRYVREIYNSSKPGLDAGGGRIIVISNSIKTGVGWSWTRDIYQKSMQKLNDFRRIFMPWSAHPLRGPNFLEQQRKEGMDDEDISEHYPETEAEAVSTRLGSYFGKVLARHDEYLMDGVTGNLIKDQFKDIVFEPDNRGLLEIWRFPYYLVDGWDGLMWERRYTIGSDISEGVGDSYSVAYVLDRYLGEIVARMRNNRTDAHKWGTLLHQLSVWYDNALIVPERTGAGITTVKRLQDLNANLYRRMIAGKAGQPATQELGWSESQQAKHELCGDLKTWLGSVKTPGVYDRILIDECSTYILTEAGRLEPEEGKLADCVIGAGCTIQGDLFIGRKPEPIQPPATGWLKEWQDEGKKGNPWVK